VSNIRRTCSAGPTTATPSHLAIFSIRPLVAMETVVTSSDRLYETASRRRGRFWPAEIRASMFTNISRRHRISSSSSSSSILAFNDEQMNGSVGHRHTSSSSSAHLLYSDRQHPPCNLLICAAPAAYKLRRSIYPHINCRPYSLRDDPIEESRGTFRHNVYRNGNFLYGAEIHAAIGIDYATYMYFLPERPFHHGCPVRIALR